MANIWVTNGSPTRPAILNPLAAACESGYRPDAVRILSNPPVADAVSEAQAAATAVIETHGGDPDVSAQEISDETDFAAIVDFYRSAIEAAAAAGDTIAVDVTPGRKFMSAIAFQSGIQFGADHVYYFHRTAGGYRGQFYPEIPRTATNLIDFTEVM